MAHASRFATLDLPSPGRAALPLLLLAAAAALVAADPQLRLAALAAAGCFGLAAAAQSLRARHELVRARRGADRLILEDRHGGEVSELVQWRCAELVEPEARAALAAELARTLRRLDPAHLPSSSPLRRGSLRVHADLLDALAGRVGDRHPVSPYGILLVQRLLRDPASPLYEEVSDAELARALSHVLGALEP